MKGIVFSEFIEFVEERFSPELADRMIEHSGAGGAYTSVGTYDHRELVGMLMQLTKDSEVPLPQLLHTFGEHMATRFAALFPQFFAAQPDFFGFLASVDNYIHVEVRKLYPDAELPSFHVVERHADEISLRYASTRHLADLAAGLIAGSALHYRTPIHVLREEAADGATLFRISRAGHAGSH